MGSRPAAPARAVVCAGARAARDAGRRLAAARGFDVAWVGACVAVGLALRAVHLGASSLWTDEFFTLIAYRRPLAESLFQRQDYAPPLYQLLLRLITYAESPGEVVLRGPAMVFGTAVIVASWWLGRVLFGRAVGLCTALLVTVNPALVHHSTEARSYTLWVFAATLSVGFFVRMVQRGRWTEVAAFVVSSVAMVYSHHYAVFTLAAEAIAFGLLVMAGKDRRRWPQVCVAFALIALGMIPAVSVVLRHLHAGAPGFEWMPAHGLLGAVRIAGEVFGAPELGALVLVPVVVALWPGHTVFEARESHRNGQCELRPAIRREAILCGLLVACGLLVLAVLGKLYRPMLLPRYVLPVVVPATALGIAFTMRVDRRLAALVVAALVVLGARGSWQAVEPRTGMREVVQGIAAAGEGRVLVAQHAYSEDFVSAELTGLRYYGLPARYEPVGLLEIRYRRGVDIENPGAFATEGRLFIVCYPHDALVRAIEAGLRRCGRQFQVVSYGGGRLYLFDVAASTSVGAGCPGEPA
jgi:4-amino-4-deoxy-L-arabinose transferase-like glycosyltransferase